MADIVSCIIEPAKVAGKWIGQQIFQQLTFLWFFTTNIKSLRDEAKLLEDATKGLQLDVDKASDNVEVIDSEVVTWLENSKSITDETSKILSEATNVESDHLKLVDRLSLSKRAKTLTDRAKDLRGQRKFNAISHSRPSAATRIVPGGKTFECESRNKIEEHIMTTLRGGDVNMIGICGMGGLGKTTMAKKIMNRVLEEHVFEEVVIATVSHNVDISKIQDEIGGQLGLVLKKETSQGKVQKLHARLSGTKRTLVILDDVWEGLVLEDFGIPRDFKGCTILLTSRDSGVLNKMGVQIFGMKVLSHEEAWSFFRERVGTCLDDRKLNPIAEQVVKECKGLPIALEIVSGVRKDEDDVSIWEDTLRQLSHSDPDIPEFIKKVYNPLKLSYDGLGSEQAKSMFLLFCLFPEDANIPLEYLTYFCMGLRIYKGVSNLKEARNKTRALTKMLKSRSLLLDSDEEDCVKMHDVVRDVCIFIAKDDGYIGKDGCTWISSSHLFGDSNELLSGSRCPNLHLLFLNRRYDSSGFKFDDAFLEGMSELHVLCIVNYYYCSLTTLPHPTQSLGKLNTLILSSCDELKSISVVGELVNLEILICHYCGSIKELPSEMKRLNRLKVLELTKCEKLQSIERGIISSLARLEELKMLDSFKRWDERENVGLRELVALPNLACLEIDIEDPSLVTENMRLLSKKIVRFLIRIGKDYRSMPSKFSKKMSLYLERETGIGDWMMQLLRDTEYLDLRGDGANNVYLAKIQDIRWLELSGCESMKKVVRTSGGDDATVFPSIEHLQLEYLPQLQEICDGPISSTSFQNLSELVLGGLKALTQFWKSSSVCENINYVPHFTNLSSIDIWICHSLRNLGQLSMAGKDCLPHLENLHIERCEMMEQVFLWNDEEAGENKNSIESQRKHHVITKVFPKLKKVELRYLRNLTTLYQGIQGIEFPLLKEMRIDECPRMMSIMKCSSADIDDSWHLFCQLQKVSFSSLEELMIENVGSMGIFTLSVAANLVSLRALEIKNCDGIVNVIEDEEENEDGKVVDGSEIRSVVFPKLEELILYKLPNLVSFCEWKCDVDFPSLTKVEIIRCPNMESFSMGFVDAPNLEIVKIDKFHKVIDGSTKDLNEALQQHYLARPKKVPFGLVIDYNPCYNHKVPSSLYNRLEELTINKYVGRMSFFTFSMAANLVSLRELRIANCDEMIKVIEDEQQQERILLFPKLKILKMENLAKLVSFCDLKCEVELPLLRKVLIFKCPNMENLSMGLVATPNLEAFTTDLTTYAGVEVGDGVSFDSMKKLKIKWNENPWYDYKICVSLFNGLEKLEFYKYKGSMSLFSSSAVGNLVNLRVLYINHCDGILVNVIEYEEEEEDEKVVSGGEISTAVFPKLEELTLYDLPKLVRFCEWKCDIELPSLREVDIRNCPNMKSFSMGFVAAPNLEIVEIDKEEIDATKDLNDTMQQQYLDHQEGISFRNKALQSNHNPFCGHEISSSLFSGLEELTIYVCVGSMTLFALSMAANLVSLKKLCIAHCYEMIKVIEDEQHQERILLFPKLEILQLRNLSKLVSFCAWKCDVELPLLRKVEIEKCPNMENFTLGLVATPCLEAFTTDLTTYVGVGVDVAFNCLKKLKIKWNKNPWCDDKISASLFNGLEKFIFYGYKEGINMSLFSCSAVGNLVNLKVLEINNCDWILVNVIEYEEEDEKLVSGGEIRSTVVFPKLELLGLYNLPQLVRFCEWKCDVALPSLTKVEIEQCPNLESFSMGFVDTPNLEIVEIDKQEIDAAKDLNGPLHQHYLARRGKVSFNLEIDYNPFYGHKVPSSLCNRLEALTINKYEGNTSFFTLSMAANLVSLRKLCIENCDEMIKVIEAEEQQKRILVFPKLEILQLRNLPKLVTFCDSKSEVELPILGEVEIKRCPNMESFSMGLVATPNLEAFTTVLTTYVGIGVDVAFNSLKELKIFENENPFDHHRISISLFNGLEILIFDDFKGSVSLFSCSAVGSLVNLRVLVIEKCDEIVKLIEDEEDKDDRKVVSGGESRSVVFPKLEELILFELPKLVRFCEWKCDVELPSLREVVIGSCPNMESFSMEGCVAAPKLEIVRIDHKEIGSTEDLNGALQQHYLARPKKENEEEESSEEKDEIEEEDDD